MTQTSDKGDLAGRPEVRPAEPGQLGTLSKVLARAFAADPMIRWPLGDAVDPEQSLETCFRLWDAGNIELGVAFEAGGGAGVAVWVPPTLTDRWAETERRARLAIYALTDDNGARYELLWDWGCRRSRCGFSTRSVWIRIARARDSAERWCSSAWLKPLGLAYPRSWRPQQSAT
jgi:hypothetical protein